MEPQLLFTRRGPLVAARLLCWLLLSGLPLLAAAQCPSGDVTLTTQAQVDAFPPGCTNFPNVLTVSGADITNLNGLKNLQNVGNNLLITNNPNLTSLDGLNKLQRVGYDFLIESNSALASITALTALTSVVNSLQIDNDPNLASLDGLNKLQRVGYNFRIETNSALASLTALTALTSVGGNLQINNDPNLASLDGLDKLQSVGYDFRIQTNSALTSITALTALTSVGGNLQINNDPKLTSLDGLNKLQSVGYDFRIQTNSTLSVCALPAICQLIATKSPDNLKISGNAPGCSSVQEVQADCTPLAITTQPPSASTVCPGATVTATVSTSGNARAYQWYQNSTALTSQTSATLTLTNVQPADAGMYRVVVSNSVSSLTSTAFTLTVMSQSPDYQALVDLYTATNGPGWTRHDNWLTGCTPCGWYGVTCDGNGRVKELTLNSNQLSGSIPASLSALTNLQTLDLSFNQLSGNIPASLSALTNLSVLFLYHNQLSGSIPASLGALTNLQYLYIDNNQLSGCLPASLSALCGRFVDLSNNPDLPGGGNFPAFCASGAGSDAFRPLATASPNPVCAGNPVSLSVTTGTFYQWSGPASFTATTQTPGLTATTPASSGLYSVTVGNGSPTCTATASVSLTVNPLPVVSVSPSATAVCAGQSATFAATPGFATYRWTTPNNGPTLTTATISVSVAGTYSLNVTNASGCTATATASLTVNALPTPAIVGLPASLCQEASPVTLTGTGTPAGGQFTIDGLPATALNPASLSVGQHTVVYAYTNASGCANTSSQPVTIKATPNAPGLLTQTGQFYAGGVASLTLSQNTGTPVLVVSGCSGGTITWAGGNATTLAVSTASPGTFTYSATCQQNGCISPAATATVVVLPTTLSVSHLDADVFNLQTNIIVPYLQLNNEGTTPIPYGEITVRYWFTAENFAPLTNLSVYYAQLGFGKVSMKYVALDQPRQGAFGYVEYSVDASAGSLPAGRDSGPIQNGIAKQDFSAFNEADDYSYAGTHTYTKTPRITAYRNGMLVWGQEPALATPVQSLKVYTENKSLLTTTNTISTWLQVSNEGNKPVSYGDLKVRYYFTAEGSQPLNFFLDYADLGNAKVKGQLVKINPPLANADTYVELSFVNLDRLYPLSNTGNIQYRISKSDFSLFTLSNDFSFLSTAFPFVENNRVSVFLGGVRVYGTAPGAGARVAADEPVSLLGITVLGNPIQGSSVGVSVSGAEGQPLQFQLLDVQGRLVSERQVARAGAVEEQRLDVSPSASGMLLLRVSTPTQSQTVKVLKAN